MPGWIWAAGGLLLLLTELMMPTDFFLFFFGCGGLLLGLMITTGMEVPFWVEMLLFVGLSMSGVLLLRRPMSLRFRASTPRRDVDTMIGETAVAQAEIAPGAIGKVEMRGSVWDARNGGETSLNVGDRRAVEKIDGLTLWLSGKEGG